MAVSDNTEDQLRAEIEDLKRRLHTPVTSARRKGPSPATLWTLAVLGVMLLVGAFFAGYLPQSSRQTALAKDAKDDSAALPIVTVTAVQTSSSKSNLVLSGDIQAVTEAPILARQSGYIKKRYVDIGDRVKEGQLLAEIDAGELDQQVKQASAGKEQAAAALEQANANLARAKTTSDMSGVTADRWKALVEKGAVARQDADTYQSQFEANQSNVQALEKAISAAKSNVAVADANVARLTELQNYLKVRAPFSGVITQRNIDTGALVTQGTTLMYRIAQTDRLRIYVNVPQSDSTAVRVGQAADVMVSNLPSQKFTGTVTRTANALDPATRTLLAEVQVSNSAALLLPGMFASVSFTTPRAEPPLIIRGDTLVVRSDGPQVAVVGKDDIVHYQRVTLGRDYGDRVEVTGGLQAGERLIVNPGDAVRNNTKVKPVLLAKTEK